MAAQRRGAPAALAPDQCRSLLEDLAQLPDPRQRRGRRHALAGVLGHTLGTDVTPMLCVHGAQLPWGELMAEGIPVLGADRVATTLRALPPLLDEVQVTLLTEHARRHLHPAT